jgi:predicted HAD superfamily Cof-like phosphohydrolase
MNNWQRKVEQFHRKFGQPVLTVPQLADESRSALRQRLLEEECEETIAAMVHGNLVEVADGLADLIYVALGTALEYGIDLDPVFKEVHRSNMDKIPGNLREDGKILKPEGWQPPDIAGVLRDQVYGF